MACALPEEATRGYIRRSRADRRRLMRKVWDRVTLTGSERRQTDLRQTVPAPAPTTPVCGQCRTDACLNLDVFVPACYAVDRRGLRPCAVIYTCGRRGTYYSRQAPEDWVPPGWQWYA